MKIRYSSVAFYKTVIVRKFQSFNRFKLGDFIALRVKLKFSSCQEL